VLKIARLRNATIPLVDGHAKVARQLMRDLSFIAGKAREARVHEDQVMGARPCRQVRRNQGGNGGRIQTSTDVTGDAPLPR